MAYAPPTITAAGLTIPSYQDILNYYLTGFQVIYGQNVYLGTDSADYQMLAILALACHDMLSAVALIYNQRSPVTAIGVGLDAVVKMNGLVRRSATNSTCTLTITGTVSTVITNGVVSDINNFQWSLPSPTTITSGSINVTATCLTLGAVTANVGAITNIVTPTAGWTSVTNGVAAVPGQPIEPDSTLRARQAQSAAAPSSTRLAGTYSDVAAVEGVTRLNVLENPGETTDAFGNPPHSITVVVEGGEDEDIALAIYNNKGIGPTVNGTNPASGAVLVTVPITDPSNGNLTQVMYFFRPAPEVLATSIFIHPLIGYTTATTGAIQTAVYNYINSLQIGQPLIYSEVYNPILNVQPNQTIPQFSVKALWIGPNDDALANTAVNAGGTGYTLGDSLIVTTGGDDGGVTVTGVSAGVVTQVTTNYNQCGSGYSVGTNIATTGGTGTGCTIDIQTIGARSFADSDDTVLFYQVAQAGVGPPASSAVNVIIV